MFQSLSDRLSGVLDKLTRRGALTESDVDEAMREVRRALLEADVALDVVRSFTDTVKAKAVGAERACKSVTPGQMVVKIVHDELVAMLGSRRPADRSRGDTAGRDHDGRPAGLGQDDDHAPRSASASPTATRKKVLMASLDTRRPAAQEQLRVLGEQTDVDDAADHRRPDAAADRAARARSGAPRRLRRGDARHRRPHPHRRRADGRRSADVRDIAKPHETLLVADSLTGQDAVNLASNFNERVGITGIVLTRVDGDGRGGAALSMRAVTGKPIKLIGVGEKLGCARGFPPAAHRRPHPRHGRRRQPRREGGGDHRRREGAGDRRRRCARASSTSRISAEQLKQMQKIGGMGGVMGMLPGIGKIKQQMAAGANSTTR